MIYIYNATLSVYKSIEEYLTAIENDSGSVYYAMFLVKIDDLFTAVKKKTALRARFAKDSNGKPLIDQLAVTDDERDFFDEVLKDGAVEVFAKLSAWSKNIDQAYKHSVIFATPESTGTITDNIGASITDNALNLVENVLSGKTLVITTPGDQLNEERDILGNTYNTISLSSAFSSSVTGMNYAIHENTDKYIIYSVIMDLGWDLNQIQGVDNAIWNALVEFITKTWYYLNRYAEDYAAEEAEFQKHLERIRHLLLRRKKNVKRPVGIFGGGPEISLTEEEETESTTVLDTAPVSSASAAGYYQFYTAELVANTLKTVYHYQNWTVGYTMQARTPDDSNNAVAEILRRSTTDPANAIEIQVTVDIPAPGLLIQIRGL